MNLQILYLFLLDIKNNYKKYYLTVGVFLILISISAIVKADDNFYAISNNTLISNDYKILTNEKINKLLIDNLSIYFYNQKHFYIVNKSDGNITYKIKIYGIDNIVQTENFIYLKTFFEIYKVNKITGIIETKNIFNEKINNIFSLFGLEKDNTKVNKTGDNITGKLVISGSGNTNLIEIYDNLSSKKNYIDSWGLQFWNLSSSINQNISVGWIAYSLPGNEQPNICFLDSSQNTSRKSCSGRRVSDGAYRISTANSTVNERNVLFAHISGVVEAPAGEGTFKGSGLSGIGSAPVCVDSSGKLYRGDTVC